MARLIPRPQGQSQTEQLQSNPKEDWSILRIYTTIDLSEWEGEKKQNKKPNGKKNKHNNLSF